MKRRDFLKKLGVVCGAVVACPVKLLKGKPDPMVGVSGPGWYVFPVFTEKQYYFKGVPIYYQRDLLI
ncbi:hypothetical protein LCGC14_1321860 [marine sediment metagenome]|uniref:Uncharacterized protein n=1 Tax=marine sediment metagenome TaxID=412755 RepID=A0A0F9N007_9ZZZZ